MRLFVHEPINTASTANAFIGVAGRKIHVLRARSAAARFVVAVCEFSVGPGTSSLTDTPWPGFVPQVTNGSRFAGVEETSTSIDSRPRRSAGVRQ